jgi:hypothetical protein
MWIGCADARAPANELMVSFLCCTHNDVWHVDASMWECTNFCTCC